MLREGCIVDVTVISARGYTKNESGGRDLEMHQTKKANQWHFCMKMRIGIDYTLGLIRSIDTMAADKLKAEKMKVSIWTKVVHLFRYIKPIFDCNKACYRDLAMNSSAQHLLAAFTNLLFCEKYLSA